MESAEDSVTVVRAIKALPSKVFAAWTDPSLLERWLAPVASADPRVGGRFRLEVQKAEGAHVVTGEYREIVPAERLVMTWRYEGPLVLAGAVQTLLTVDLRAAGSNTEVRLHHEGLTDPRYRDVLRQGAWTQALDALDGIMGGPAPGAA